MRHSSASLALPVVFAFACADTTAPQNDASIPGPSFDFANSGNPNSAVFIGAVGCSFLDGDGGLVFVNNASAVITSSGQGKFQCSAKGVPNSTGRAVTYDTDKNPSGPGLLCGMPGDPDGTAKWHETVSASGNAKLTCHNDGVQPAPPPPPPPPPPPGVELPLEDTDPPAFGPLNPVPIGSPGTDAAAIVMTIGETIWDRSIISQATLSMLADGTDANGSGADGNCDIATNYLLNPGSGEIDQNAVDLTNGTNTITFNESFTITRPPAPVNPVFYCFWVTAQDAAGNSDSLFTAALVTWNP